MRKIDEEYSTEGKENNDDSDDNGDEEWLRVAEYVSGAKFSDYISLDQDIATYCVLSIEEMCDDATNENNGEEAEDNVYADEAEPVCLTQLRHLKLYKH